jgi:glycosyltransferase involved in cell wall biosynthesis
MTKQKVLIFSDCYIYGGSEKLMGSLIKNEILNENYNLLYAYRKHKIYEEGLKNENLLNRANNYPIYLLSNNTLFYKINCLSLSFYLKLILKIPFFILEIFKIYFIWNLINLILLLIKTKPDIIHVNNGGYPGSKTCNIIVIANYLIGNSKIIYQINNQALAQKNYLNKKYDEFIDKKVTFFITASIMAKNDLIKKRHFTPNKILLINNCVYLPEITKTKLDITKELKIPNDSYLIVQVGFLTDRKGQKFIINAIHNIIKNKNELKDKIYCLLIGDGENEKLLNKQIIELNLSKNILLLGYKNNSEDYINASDLFVLPSIKNEDMPLVLLSALGYGKPILASDLAGISQVIKNNFNGILVNPNDKNFEHELSKEIMRIYNDKNLHLLLSSNAKSTYSNYNPKNYGLKMKSIYEKLFE